MLRAPRTRPFARRCRGLLVALFVLTGTLSAHADEPKDEVGHGRSALPAVEVVPVLVAERAHVIRAHAALGYGYTEEVLDAGDGDELVAGHARWVVQGEEERGAVADGAPGDGPTELDEPIGHGAVPGAGLTDALGEGVEVGAVALDQLDDDRVLGVEVVVEAPGLDAGGIRDLFQRGAKAR